MDGIVGLRWGLSGRASIGQVTGCQENDGTAWFVSRGRVCQKARKGVDGIVRCGGNHMWRGLSGGCWYVLGLSAMARA